MQQNLVPSHSQFDLEYMSMFKINNICIGEKSQYQSNVWPPQTVFETVSGSIEVWNWQSTCTVDFYVHIDYLLKIVIILMQQNVKITRI